MSNIEEIQNNVKKWASKYLKDFQFRTYQLEYITNTIKNILNDVSINIIEAPTGSGKSIMIIIMAGVLDKYYGLKSYILCSDLYLWQQYEDAINYHDLYFGKLKGSWGNYNCNLTNCDLLNAPCKLSYIPYTNLTNFDWCMLNGWSCATSCKYMLERKKAMLSPVTLLTYQLYFPYMNNDMALDSFKPRDIVFCDECHRIPDLCQEYGTVTLNLHRDCEKIYSLLEFCKDYEITLSNGTNMKDVDIDEYMCQLRDLYFELMQIPFQKQLELLNKLKEYQKALHNYPLKCFKVLKEKYMKGSKKRLKKAEYTALNNAKWVDAQCSIINTYLNFADTKENVKYLTKTDNMFYDFEHKCMCWPDESIITFKYAKEDVWVNKFLLSHQKYNVLLSATIGDHDSYDDNIGTKLVENRQSIMDRMPTTFDFSMSPIYFIPGNKMSKDYINTSFPKNANIINKILLSDKHKNEKGIIHTGSYNNAYRLLEYLDSNVKNRIFIYSESKEKQETIEKFKESKNGILVGPTLNEGIDLPGDYCRFIIILKIPYPYLGDNLVKAKTLLFPKWYNSQTSNNVIQGIGRGNRTPTDQSTTYILDGSFSNLYQATYLQYPDYMKARIHILNS